MKTLRPCLVTVFVFYFRFLVFKGKREKKKNSVFKNEKRVWLVERKNTFSKYKIH